MKEKVANLIRQAFSDKNRTKCLFIPFYGFAKRKTNNKALKYGIINLAVLLVLALIITITAANSVQNAKNRAFREKYFPKKTAIELKEEYNLPEIGYKVSLPTSDYKVMNETTLLETDAGYVAITVSDTLEDGSIEEQNKELDSLTRKNIHDKFVIDKFKTSYESLGEISNMVSLQNEGNLDIKGKGNCYYISYFIQINDTTACKITGFSDGPFAPKGKKDAIASAVDSIAKSLNK